MFWALALKPNRRYSQTVKRGFHLSNAALDVRNCTDNEPIQVVMVHCNREYVLCNLRKNKVEQVSLDLTFAKGELVTFISQGSGNVHLSGYILEDLYDESDESDDEEDYESNEVAYQTQKEKKKKSKKEEENSLLAALEKAKDEDDEMDSDFKLEEDDDEDDDDEDAEEEVEDDDDDDDEDDEEEEDDEEVQESKPKKIKLSNAKQNGVENGDVSAKEETKKDNKKNKQKQQQQQQKPQQKTLQAGVKIEDIHVGNGPEVKPGKKCSIYYEGRLKLNNKVFDSTKEGKGLKFAVGKGEVIKGMDIGIVGMKVGGKRRIICPPHVAYGVKGQPPVIPPNSTLVFEIELKSVN